LAQLANSNRRGHVRLSVAHTGEVCPYLSYGGDVGSLYAA
jgi:hypothetical protein